MSVHSFVVDEAVLYGVEKATLIFNLRYWLTKNKSNESHIYEGFYWTYNSATAFHILFPYMSKQKIARHLRDLESLDVVKSGNFNKAGYDKTKWYTLPKEFAIPHESSCFNFEQSNVQIQTMDGLDLNNGMFNFEQPIPNINTNNKPNINTITISDIEDVINLYNETIDNHKPNWSKVQEITDDRKRSTKNIINFAKKRIKQSEDQNEKPIKYLERLFIAMCENQFHAGKIPSAQHPNGYRWTFDQVVRQKNLINFIEKESA